MDETLHGRIRRCAQCEILPVGVARGFQLRRPLERMADRPVEPGIGIFRIQFRAAHEGVQRAAAIYSAQESEFTIGRMFTKPPEREIDARIVRSDAAGPFERGSRLTDSAAPRLGVGQEAERLHVRGVGLRESGCQAERLVESCEVTEERLALGELRVQVQRDGKRVLKFLGVRDIAEESAGAAEEQFFLMRLMSIRSALPGGWACGQPLARWARCGNRAQA